LSLSGLAEPAGPAGRYLRKGQDMGGYDQTSMGGDRGTFLTTHWSLIEDVKQGQDKDRALIGLLLERYWKPVYCYLRSKGYNNDQAKDLTQGFLHEVVLNRHLIDRADTSKGHYSPGHQAVEYPGRHGGRPGSAQDY
jgi:hypothetical protein